MPPPKRQPRIRRDRTKFYIYQVVCICTVGEKRTNETRYFQEVRVRGGTPRAEIFNEARKLIRRNPLYSNYPCLREARRTHQKQNFECRIVGTVLEDIGDVPF